MIQPEAPASSSLAQMKIPASPKLGSFSLRQSKTLWGHLVLTPNIFEILSVDDDDEDDDEEDNNEDGYTVFTPRMPDRFHTFFDFRMSNNFYERSC